MENYSAELKCKECGKFDTTESGRKFFDALVGVHLAPVQKGDRHYAAVCECPECFSQFWFHLNDFDAGTYKMLYEAGELKIKPKK